MAIGWGIVSTGRHPDTKMAPAINEADGASLAAVMSRDMGRAEAFAQKHGSASACDDLDALLRDPAVDVVYIASPNALHAEQTVRAAQAGKHVLVEKPMALSVDDAQRMIDACDMAGVRLGVGFTCGRTRGTGGCGRSWLTARWAGWRSRTRIGAGGCGAKRRRRRVRACRRGGTTRRSSARARSWRRACTVPTCFATSSATTLRRSPP